MGCSEMETELEHPARFLGYCWISEIPEGGTLREGSPMHYPLAA